MRKITIIALGLALFVAGFAATTGGSGVLAGDGDRVTLCHATGNSDTFPADKYVTITVAASAAFHGHLGGGHQNGNDIIPPFQYEGQTYSQHWDAAGQAIFTTDCGEPDDTTTTTTTTDTTTPTVPTTTTTTTGTTPTVPTTTTTTAPTVPTVTTPTQPETTTTPTPTVTPTEPARPRKAPKRPPGAEPAPQRPPGAEEPTLPYTP